MSTTMPGCTEVQIGGNRLTKPVTLRVTVHGDNAHDIENFRPCLVKGRYWPYNRWHVVEAVHAFGLDVLDDYLPFAIESPNTIVYAVVPLTLEDIDVLELFYANKEYSYAAYPPVAAFPVWELPRSRDDLLMFARAAQDAYRCGSVLGAIMLLSTKTQLAGVPTTLWWTANLRSHKIDLFVSLYRFFKNRDDKFGSYYSITKSKWPVKRKYASAPFRSPGGYEPFTRWEIVEMVRGFGLDVMDDVLPYVIDNDYEVVYAMLPNDKLSTQIYRTYLPKYVHQCYGYESSYLGIRVVDYVNTLDEFIEMLVCSSRNLLIVNAANKIVQVDVSASFNTALRHSVLRRAVSAV